VVAGSHHFEEELDPDLRICNPEQNLQFKKWVKNRQICLHKPFKRTFRHFKNEILYFVSFLVGQFLPAWIRISSLDPDPVAQLKTDQIRTGSKTLTAE
jgi:hypothetical protein